MIIGKFHDINEDGLFYFGRTTSITRGGGERAGRWMVAQFLRFRVLVATVINRGDAVIKKPGSHLNSNFLVRNGLSTMMAYLITASP